MSAGTASAPSVPGYSLGYATPLAAFVLLVFLVPLLYLVALHK